MRLQCFLRVVDSLDRFQKLVVPRCDVITHVIQHTDDRYQNATRFFTSSAQSFSRDHVVGDVTASRDPDDTGATPSDVMPATRRTFRLVLFCLDVIILLYRVCHVCRVVNRMMNSWSRDDRKYYYYDGDDDEEYSVAEMMTRESTKRSASLTTGRSELDQVEETLYQLPSSSSSSLESSPICRLIRSTYVAKLVLFAALVTSCHVTLEMIDSSQLSAHIDVVTVTSDSALLRLDTDVDAIYRRQRDDVTTSFNDFVVASLSHLSVMVQLINNGDFTYTVSQLQLPEPLRFVGITLLLYAISRQTFPRI